MAIEVPQKYLENAHLLKDVARDNFNLAGLGGETSPRLGVSVESSVDNSSTYKPGGNTFG